MPRLKKDRHAIKRYSLWPPRQLLGAVARRLTGTITRVSTQEAVVALTFDDGPHPEFTPRLLDILAKHQAQATFFMIGQVAQQYPKIVRQVAQAGHAIGNHTWDHPSLPLISRRERWRQIRACARAIAPYGQRLLRPPYGHESMASRLDALWLGYRAVTWNVLAYDWLDHDARWMADHLMKRIKPGSIVLLHDALYHTLEPEYTDREPMLETVDRLLTQLGPRFRFVTVPELLRHGHPHRRIYHGKPDLAWLNKLQGQEEEARRYAHSSEPR